jgi:hypothetical protein
MRHRAQCKVATLVVATVAALAAGCGAGSGEDEGSPGALDPRDPRPAATNAPPRTSDKLLAPVVVCSTAPSFLGTGIDVLNVAYSGIPVAWDGSPFETSLEGDLDASNQQPWLFQPNGLAYEWLAFPLPASYPQSVTDLVNAYASVPPVNSEILECTSIGLLSGGGLLGATTTDYVVWDPRGGGVGD